MAIDKNSNGFTFGFAIAMVVIVGAILSVLAMSLKPKQKENLSQEKMKNILTSAGIMTSDQDMAEAPSLFDQYVKDQYILDASGQVIEGSDLSAFDIDVRKQYKKLKAGAVEESALKYPLFRIEKDGDSFWVVPMVGTGLWGPIWGYVALEGNVNTVYGANFDHKSETPGLGAEIKEPIFTKQFPGEKIFNEDGEFVSIAVLKGGGGNESDHAVDGITGGTITSVGVDEMISNTLEVYVPYFKKIKA